MNVNLSFLLLALLLLWFPRHWLRLGSVFKRRRSAESVRTAKEPWNSREPGDPRVNFSTEFSKFRNYVDLLRGTVGSVALSGGMGLAASVTLAEDAPSNMIYAVLALRSAIMLVGMLVQTVRFEKRRPTFYPPIFYIAGLSVGLSDYRSALFAFALIWALNLMFSGAQGFLTAYAVFIVVFGHLFAKGADLSVIFAAILCFLPVLLSLLANRPLVVFSRKGTHTTKQP